MFTTRHPDYEKYRRLTSGVYTLEGGIGAGKTTLGNALVQHLTVVGLEAKFFPEYVNKPFLNQYIADQWKYGFAFQLLTLCKRISIYKEAKAFAATGGIAIIDRSIIGDKAFAKMLKDDGKINEAEWNNYLGMMRDEIQLTPSASIFLECTPDTSMERVKKRGIESEIKGYGVEYMRKVRSAYEATMAECTNVLHIKINWDAPATTEDGTLALSSTRKVLDMLCDPEHYAGEKCQTCGAALDVNDLS
jgi:deoxyadenosine/deoxycytidine kinase